MFKKEKKWTVLSCIRSTVYFFLYFNLRLFSLLPFRIIYFFSDILYCWVCYILKYRRKVIWCNLQKAFPNKTAYEKKKILQQYYRHLCDLTLEFFKALTISKKQIRKRCVFNNVSLLHRLYAQKRHIILVMAHNGNWEWAGNSLMLFTKYRLCAVYKPLKNLFFDRVLYQLRSRFHRKAIPLQRIFKTMLQNQSDLQATVFLFDQYPSNPTGAFSTEFLHQKTRFFLGPANIAKKLNYPVVYVRIDKKKRGYYTIDLSLIEENPQTSNPQNIMMACVQKLTQDIQKTPSGWLWSHKRWKDQINYPN